jgi:hypothetical protein
MCDNKVELYAPRGYDYVAYEAKCGTTDHYGDRVICDSCASDPAEMAEIERHQRNVAADNAWLRSAGWGEM